MNRPLANRADQRDAQRADSGPASLGLDEEESHGDPEGLLAAVAAAKQRKRAARRRPEPAPTPAEDSESDDEPRMSDALALIGDDYDAPTPRRRAAPRPISETIEKPDDKAKAKPRAKKPAKRQALTDAVAVATSARGPGLVTRGVHVGLSGLYRARRLGLWGGAAVAAAILVSVLSWRAALVLPTPAPVSGLRIVFHDGPTLPREDILAWVRRGFPQRASLVDPDDATLERLAEFLRSQGAVREVHQVRVAHEAFTGGITRVIELGLSLREPYMPAVLANGERHWVDADGRVLPGILPAPTVSRPVLRGIEVGGPPAVAEALALWRELEAQVEPGLITDIHLFDDLDLKDQRGIVLATRQGSRLIWGRPAEDRYGVDRARKVRDLVHTIRCQGDLSRIAVINVRFGQPFFVLR